MMDRTILIALLCALMGLAAYVQTNPTTVWVIVLYGLPIGLIGCLLAHQRWALMAVVMYGTVGLALDVSTIVQTVTKPDLPQMAAVTCGLTGLLNFLLIVFGGRSFLNISGASSLPESPRPNPPSPSSS